jgi:hypothetical protein
MQIVEIILAVMPGPKFWAYLIAGLLVLYGVWHIWNANAHHAIMALACGLGLFFLSRAIQRGQL